MQTIKDIRRKIWHVKEKPDQTSIIDWLYQSRGMQRQQADNLLSRDPMQLFGMEKAVKRIREAIEKQEHVVIHGDYDVDGITSATTLYLGLTQLGAKNVTVFLPDRLKDGYGLKMHTIDRLSTDHTLLITVDCGISNHAEISHAKTKGLEVIVIDHHNIPEVLPEAVAVINPKLAYCPYPFDFLCACGVVLKTLQALGLDPNHFLDLAAIATVADCMPLIDENREIVTKGLQKIRSNPRPGIAAILASSGTDPKHTSSTTIGFQIGPRINAAGRISFPEEAYKTLKAATNEEAYTFAANLEKLNLKRREMLQESMKEAKLQASQEASILIVKNPSWHPGIVGLIAGRLAERYGKPAIAIHGSEDHMVGSARSIAGFNITEAIKTQAEHLETYGGHSEAAGFTIKPGHFDAFRQGLEEHTQKALAKADLRPSLTLDCRVRGEDITFNLIDEIEAMEPFGIGNPKPLFHIKQARVSEIKAVGKTGSHLKFQFSIDARFFDGIYFSSGELKEQIRRGDILNIACHLAKNTWMDRTKIQLEIKDLSFA